MQKKQSNYYANTRSEMLEFLPRNAQRVADIGCGGGVFAESIKDKNNAEVWGVELDTQSAKLAQKKLDRVINKPIEEALADLPANYFDVIYCNDVLEHLYDPESAIKELKKKLKKQGVLISSIPNIRYFHTFIALLLARDWEYTHDGVLDFTHLRFFTDKSIVNMHQRAGFKVIRQEGINPTLNIPLKFKIINVLLKRKFSDSQYIQFATVAQKS